MATTSGFGLTRLGCKRFSRFGASSKRYVIPCANCAAEVASRMEQHCIHGALTGSIPQPALLLNAIFSPFQSRGMNGREEEGADSASRTTTDLPALTACPTHCMLLCWSQPWLHGQPQHSTAQHSSALLCFALFWTALLCSLPKPFPASSPLQGVSMGLSPNQGRENK